MADGLGVDVATVNVGAGVLVDSPGLSETCGAGAQAASRARHAENQTACPIVTVQSCAPWLKAQAASITRSSRRSYVRMAWQFAHTRSHFSSSARTVAMLLRRTREATSERFWVPGR